MELVQQINTAINQVVWGVPMLILLLGVGILMTVRSGGLQFRRFGYAMRNTLGKVLKKSEAGEGEITPFQAVATALAGTLGTGSIAGITTAVTLGGPGTLFWLWITALIGMATKYAEVLLAVKFRERNERGDWVGGPMYYIKNGLGKKWKWLGALFCIFAALAALGTGNAIQAGNIVGAINTLVLSFDPSFGGTETLKLVLGIVLAILAGLYLTAVYSDIPFIAKWRTAYIQTAMNTLSHQWLATAFIPRSVIDKVLAEMEAAREAQIGINSEWDEGESESRNPTLTNTKGMSKEEIAFYNLFWEVNVPSMQAYVKEHPDALAAGWSRINIDKSALTADGTSIRTIQGEQVLAIDARNKILIARVKGSTYRGVLVIMKDPSRLSLQAASTLGSVGQVCGKIAEAHGGVIGMTGSGFIDPGGTGNGGTLAGYAMCNGKSYGSHMGYGYKRLELHKDNRIYIRDSDSSVSPDTTDAVEFSPAMIIDGETVVNARSGFSDLQPRACLGQSKYGEIIALLVEGRLTTSVGISVPDCAAIMTKHDCMQAMNLDGGTSAMIWYKGKYIMRSSNPALTAGRTLPNAFVYTGN